MIGGVVVPCPPCPECDGDGRHRCVIDGIQCWFGTDGYNRRAEVIVAIAVANHHWIPWCIGELNACDSGWCQQPYHA